MNQIYSDESSPFQGQYRSIAALSGDSDNLSSLRKRLDEVLEGNDITELKWNDLGSNSTKEEAARNFITDILNFAKEGKVRMDVITWDTNDYRNSIQGRDDEKNFNIMYYYTLRHVCQVQNCREWEMYPDEQNQLKSAELKKYIENTSNREASETLDSFEEGDFQFNLKYFEEQDSKEEALIQAADLFAGMANFSHDKEKFLSRLIDGKNSCRRLPGLEEEGDVSDRTKKRAKLIDFLCHECTQRKLGVSIHKRNYLRTPSPSNPINFWFYEVQGNYDKAPTK